MTSTKTSANGSVGGKLAAAAGEIVLKGVSKSYGGGLFAKQVVH